MGGEGCEETLSETRGCDSRPCPTECSPVDCKWSGWNHWGACDKCGGEKKRFRHILAHAHCGGKPCEPTVAEEAMNCTRTCHEPSYCAFGNWQSWSDCSADCGSGVRNRKRLLELTAAPVRFLDAAPEWTKLDASS